MSRGDSTDAPIPSGARPTGKGAKRYDAFMSYSQAADGAFAPSLQTALQRLAKSWRKRRALEIFRDKTGLGVTPALWPSICDALDGAEWFVLLASPESARSEWVGKEIEYWVSRKGAAKILPVLTSGTWRWDTNTGDLASDASAVHPKLHGVFAHEPRYLDLTWAKVPEVDLTLRNLHFRDQVAELAAPMHGIPKDELEGEDIRLALVAARLRRAGVVALATLTVVALIATAFAWSSYIAVSHRNALLTARAIARNAATFQLTQPDLARQLTALAYQLAQRAGMLPDQDLDTVVLEAAALPRTAVIGHRPLAPRSAFTPDGRAIVVGHDTGIEILDADTLRSISVVRPQEDGHPVEGSIGEVTGLDVNARSILVAAAQTGIWIWDISTLASPRQLSATRAPNTDESRWGNVVFAPSGDLLAYNHSRGPVLLLDLRDPASPRKLSQIPAEDPNLHEVGQFAFSADGRTLAVHDNEIGTATIWDISNPYEPRKRATLRDAESKQYNSHPPPAIAFSKKHLLAYAGNHDTVHLWRVNDQDEPEFLTTLRDQRDTVTALAFAPNTDVLVSGAQDGAVQSVDIRDPEQPDLLGILTQHTAAVTGIAFAPNSLRVATTSEDISLRMRYSADPRRRAASAFIDGTDPQHLLAASRDKTLMVTGGAGVDGSHSKLTLWRTSTDPTLEPLGSIQLRGQVTQGAIHAESGLVVAATDEAVRLVGITNARAPRLLGEIELDVTGPTTVALSGDGRVLAIGKWDGTITTYDVSNREAPKRLITFDRCGTDEKTRFGSVQSLAFDPAHPRLAAAAWTKLVLVWNLETPSSPSCMLRSEQHTDEVFRVGFSPDGHWLASADRVGTILLWDMSPKLEPSTEPAPIAHLSAKGRDIPVFDFSPDSSQLVAAASDRTLRFWSLRNGERPVQRLSLADSRSRPLALQFGPKATTVWMDVDDPAIDVREIDPATIARRLCAGAGVAITPAEWAEHVPSDFVYDPPCR